MSNIFSTLGNDLGTLGNNFVQGLSSGAQQAGQAIVDQAFPQQHSAPQSTTPTPNIIQSTFSNINMWQWIAIGAVLVLGTIVLIKIK
jgi:uncharacterized membrane protein YgcG